MTLSETASKVWFITGASSGFGRQWAVDVAKSGDRVVAVARSIAALDELADEFGPAILPLKLDVSDRSAVFDAVAHAKQHFGRIDVVVNNAGYGHFGMIEETTETEAREQFDTNVFGTLWVTQAVLPILRAQGAGHIIQVSSVAGLTATAGLGLYSASKFALEGMTQALAAEVRGFGIKVTLVEPTGYATGQGQNAPHISAALAEYEGLRADVFRQARSATWGDPQATSAAILTLADAPEPPLRLFLGEGLVELISAEYAERISTWREWETTASAAAGL
jgi:NAD(P)-dependent dehydrogenase (short-subunit alcohol dehydrogenase family)